MRPIEKPAEVEVEEGFLRRHWGKLLSAAILVSFGIMVARSLPGPSAPVRKAPEHLVVAIQLPPPPPPPPPPPRFVPPKEEKMEEQTPVEKPEDKPEAPKADETPALGTGIKGPGSDVFNLGSSGDRGTGRFGPGGGRGSKYGAYAYKVQSRISNVMRSNAKTRSASFSGEVRIWADAGGQITKAQFVGDSSDASLSSAIRNEVLVGQRLDEPPPAEMKMPIVMRVSARRP